MCVMSGEKNRKMIDPVLTSLLMDRGLIARLDRQTTVLSRKNGFKISRADLIRMVLQNYLNCVC